VKLFARFLIKGENHRKAYIFKNIATVNASQGDTPIAQFCSENQKGKELLLWPLVFLLSNLKLRSPKEFCIS